MTTLCEFKEVNGMTVIAPADDDARQKFQKAQRSKVYNVTFKRVRNPAFHRKTFALINACFENQDEYDHPETFREAMKIACGWVEFTTHIVSESGEVQTHIKTKSQSFGECTEEEAAELWPRICEWAVPYIGHEGVNSFEGGWR